MRRDSLQRASKNSLLARIELPPGARHPSHAQEDINLRFPKPAKLESNKSECRTGSAAAPVASAAVGRGRARRAGVSLDFRALIVIVGVASDQENPGVTGLPCWRLHIGLGLPHTAFLQNLRFTWAKRLNIHLSIVRDIRV